MIKRTGRREDEAARVSFPPLSADDGEQLAAVLTEEHWPYHSGPPPDRAKVLSHVRAGVYNSETTMTFWVVCDGAREGFIRVFDLEDDTAMFDLRLRQRARGRGIGTLTVKWLVDHVFQTVASVRRIEATTRADNEAMRRALLANGFVKEAHYRQAWPGEDRRHDSIGYAILRTDWKSGGATPVDWEDEPRGTSARPPDDA